MTREEIEKQIMAIEDMAAVYKGCTDGSYQAVLATQGYYKLKKQLEEIDGHHHLQRG